jgi:cytochrome c oxidase cbb3-type subunit 3
MLAATVVQPTPSSSARRQLLVSALAVLATIGGGSLECSRGDLTPIERHGHQLYGRMCAVCHGMNGEGYKADNAPRLRHPDFLSSATDSFLNVAIAGGRRDTVMSAWSMTRGGPLDGDDVTALVAFLRRWDYRPHPGLDRRPLRGDQKKGEQLFAKECRKCHGDKGIGGPNVHIGGRELLATADNGFLRYAIMNGRRGTAMPAFAKTLGQQGVDDVIAALRAWGTPPPPPPPPPPVRPPPLPLGPVPLNPKGPEPIGFVAYPGTTHVDDIKAQLERHAKMAILDARTPSDYTYDHIAGAVSVPFYDPSPYFDKLPKNAWLICYCSCPSAESGMLASALQAHGFTKVTVMAEGLGGWKSKKGETKNGEAP